MSDEPAPLIGNVSTVFTYREHEDFDEAVEQARAEQELVCGYELKLLSARQTRMQDDGGRDIYEVYATFGPLSDERASGEERSEE